MNKKNDYCLFVSDLLLTFLFLFYLKIVSLINNTSFLWPFKNSLSINDFQVIYPDFTILAFLMFKVIPLSVSVILIILNILVLIKFRKNYSIFIEVLEHKIFLKQFWLEIAIIIFILQVFSILGDSNFYYSLGLIFSIILFYIFFKKNWFENRKYSLLYLILIAILLRLVYISQTGIDDTREDSLARIAQVYHWVEFGGIPGQLIWLPGYHYLVYGISILFQISFETGGVLLSLISSVGLIISVYLLFEKLFDKFIGLLVACFIVFNPYLVQFSANQMSGVPFLFFLVLGTYFAELYFEKSKVSFLVFSILAFNIANLIRFEGWIITFLFMFVFILQYKNYKKTILLFFPSAITAISSAILSFFLWGDPFYGVTLSDIEVNLASQHHESEVLEKVYSYLYSNNWIPLFLIPFLFIGLFIGIFEKKNKYLALGILLLIFYYCFKMFSGTLEPFWRYFNVVLIFSMPFLFYFLKKWMSNFALIVLVFILLPYWSIHKIEGIIEGYDPLPKGFKESAIFFKLKSSKDDKVILSMNPYSDDDLWISKCSRTLDSNTYSNWYPGMYITENRQPFTVQRLKNKIIKDKFEWLIIDREFSIDSLFEDEEFANYYESIDKQSDTIGDIVLIQMNH